MKTLNEVCDNILESVQSKDNRLVNFYASEEGYKAIDPPVFSQDFSCHGCGNKEFFLWMIDKENTAWMCARICRPSKLPKDVKATTLEGKSFRAIPWASWCEINGIGDLMYDVRFEKINQSKAKIDFLLKFAQKPSGFILMQGNKGLGKTYACLGTCELFTRNSSSCIFTTQKTMMTRWFEQDKITNSFLNTSLLVIDDFGIGEISAGFMSYFMDLMNTRMQWSNRGTIITTNLSDSLLGKYCGEALIDRLNTGQKFTFDGSSRRILKPI